MNSRVEKVDFDQLAKDIIIGGGTADYAVPLGSEVSSDFTDALTSLKNPKHPGDLAYLEGQYILIKSKKDIPQFIIDAQHQSVRDAIKHYMPYEKIAQHLCSFIQGDFIYNPAFKNVMLQNTNHLPSRAMNSDTDYKRLDNALTYQFDNPAHKTTERKYFTAQEIDTVHHITKFHPCINMTVAAFQAGCIDFLQNVENAFARNTDIEKNDKTRAGSIVAVLKRQWTSSNFASDIIPFIALAYHGRDPSLLSPVEEQDYLTGYSLGLRMGLYRNHIQSPLPEDHPQSGMRKFSCPARVAISSILSRDWEETNEGNTMNGRMLALIHRRLVNGGLAPPPKPFEPRTVSTEGHDPF